MHESVLHVIANILSANTFIYRFNQEAIDLKEMNRLHTREEYMTLIDKIRTIIPDGSIARYDYRFSNGNRRRPSRHLSLMEYVI
jgi:tRNA-2-methylthio-N6-dimethylallyladenosine synthase